MLDIIMDSVKDTLRLLPFLFLSYLVVEYAEHRMSSRTREWIHRAGKAGPILGSLIGLIPQCGFSAAAAGLFAGGMVSPGTLLAVFLSTSDEMLPIMLSEGTPAGMILRILAVKAVVGMASGLILDGVLGSIRKGQKGSEPFAEKEKEHLEMCEHDHCHCSEHGIVRSAVHHTIQVTVFIFLASLILGFGMDWFGATAFSRGIFRVPGVQEAAAALVGLIPNCAASVMITQLFLEGVIQSGALFSGLLCGAGTGLLVLYRENGNRRENLCFTVILYLTGTAAGILLGHLGIL